VVAHHIAIAIFYYLLALHVQTKTIAGGLQLSCGFVFRSLHDLIVRKDLKKSIDARRKRPFEKNRIFIVGKDTIVLHDL